MIYQQTNTLKQIKSWNKYWEITINQKYRLMCKNTFEIVKSMNKINTTDTNHMNYYNQYLKQRNHENQSQWTS